MFKIKTYNAISTKGLDRFGRDKYEVASEVGPPDGYILRSHKLHGEAVPETVKAVAERVPGLTTCRWTNTPSKGSWYSIPRAPMPMR